MSPTSRALSLALVAVAALAAGVEAQERVLRGQLVAAGTAEPVAGVAVRIPALELAGLTDERGVFELAGITDTVITIEFARLGFEPRTITLRFLEGWVAGDLGVLEMEPLATPLEDIEVVAEGASRTLSLAGFYERRREGAGTFVEREQLDRWNPEAFSDVVRHVGGFMVTPNPNYGRPLPAQRSAFGYVVAPSEGVDTRKVVIASRRGRAGCAVALFVDGVFVGTTMDTDIDRYVNPVHVEAVEVYDGPADVPAQFNKGNAPCGAFVIWTRT